MLKINLVFYGDSNTSDLKNIPSLWVLQEKICSRHDIILNNGNACKNPFQSNTKQSLLATYSKQNSRCR